MGHDFDRVIERRRIESNKWRKYEANRDFLVAYTRKRSRLAEGLDRMRDALAAARR